MNGELLLTAKSLHIIFVIAWFAGLFYIPRLFIYHVEAQSKPDAEKKALSEQLKIMASRLWFIITWPAMIITVLTAGILLWIVPAYLSMPWMHVKLGFVGLLLIYHFSLHWLYRKQQRDEFPMTSTQLRFYNELATILLFAIIFTVVFKTTISWFYGAGGLVLLGVVLSLGIMLYRKSRNKKSD